MFATLWGTIKAGLHSDFLFLNLFYFSWRIRTN